MRPIEAEHVGLCLICESPIHEDELIVKLDEEWVHARCAEDEGEVIEWPE